MTSNVPTKSAEASREVHWDASVETLFEQYRQQFDEEQHKQATAGAPEEVPTRSSSKTLHAKLRKNAKTSIETQLGGFLRWIGVLPSQQAVAPAASERGLTDVSHQPLRSRSLSRGSFKRVSSAGARSPLRAERRQSRFIVQGER